MKRAVIRAVRAGCSKGSSWENICKIAIKTLYFKDYYFFRLGLLLKWKKASITMGQFQVFYRKEVF